MNFEIETARPYSFDENYFQNFYEDDRIIRFHRKDFFFILDKTGVERVMLPPEIRETFIKQKLSYASFCPFKNGNTYGIITNNKVYELSVDFSKVERCYTIQNEFKRETYTDGSTRALFPSVPGYSSISNRIPFAFINYGMMQEITFYSILNLNPTDLTARWELQTEAMLPYKLMRGIKGEMVFYLSLFQDKCYIVSPGTDIQYYTYPNYSLIAVDSTASSFEYQFKPEQKSFMKMLNETQAVITPYDFQKTKQKTNNESIYDFTENEYIEFNISKEYNNCRIIGKTKNKLWLFVFTKNGQKIINMDIVK
ncbi:hypothetical protein [Aquimarina sp. SS2-1]|uniref:hypothetical protein n=1 Tax=Aquimarina besae TaxID=3342247 RepID=UPI00366BF7C9